MAFDDDVIAASVIIALGLTGVAINVYVLFAVTRVKTFGYAFGGVCLSHTVANLGITGVFSMLVGPITLIDPTWHQTYWGKRCGQVLIMFWNAAVFSHLLIAINRCVSMYWPIKYEHIFQRKVTLVTICMAWTAAFTQVFSYFWIDCTFGFSTSTYTFTFVQTPCGYYIGYIFDYYMSIVMISLIATLDLSTFIKIRMYKKSQINSHAGHVAAAKRIRDIRFFFQACAQGLAFMGELVSFFSISTLFDDNKWAHFAFTTVAWIGVHTIDGLIVILFNKEVRNVCEIKSGIFHTTTSSSAPVTHFPFPFRFSIRLVDHH
ncbi:hypothetical protein QR680_007181 [Steinernema hermaphroditum]|uniref:7TM GPCR serpentine receptor class x (Srx) domain-containing protein n=1 Tax=Steinernema hermaphroditum TaxID=289476 RepID=A0AA39HZ53_9BILA|nr:hypothetical protein QR680_007181 [Steinernema hermaphroditum]